MNRLQHSVLQVAAIVAIVTSSVCLDAQTSVAASQSDSIAVSAVMENAKVTTGQTPRVILIIENLGAGIVKETGDPERYRLYVEGGLGAATKTYWYRQILREPGLPVLDGGGPDVSRDILPGKSIDRTFLLSAFYDLSLPGKYSVYLEAEDVSGKWLRTNTVDFEIKAPAK